MHCGRTLRSCLPPDDLRCSLFRNPRWTNATEEGQNVEWECCTKTMAHRCRARCVAEVAQTKGNQGVGLVLEAPTNLGLVRSPIPLKKIHCKGTLVVPCTRPLSCVQEARRAQAAAVAQEARRTQAAVTVQEAPRIQALEPAKRIDNANTTMNEGLGISPNVAAHFDTPLWEQPARTALNGQNYSSRPCQWEQQG